jgi:LSD1 subclass zinc finger protein
MDDGKIFPLTNENKEGKGNNNGMTEVRCVKCRRLLFKAEGSFKTEIKCPKCKYINKISSVGTTLSMGDSRVFVLVDENAKENEWQVGSR